MTPIKEMVGAALKKRPGRLRLLLYVQLVIYSLYWFNISSKGMIYIFGSKVYPDFGNADFAAFNSLLDVLTILVLLVFMPLVMPRLNAHESILLVWVSALDALGYLLVAFSAEKWELFVAQGVLPMFRFCTYALGRTMFTRGIGEDEIGKIFSVIAVGSAVMPTVSGNIFRSLYNATIDAFPGSFWLLAASVSVVCVYMNFGIYTQRREFKKNMP